MAFQSEVLLVDCAEAAFSNAPVNASNFRLQAANNALMLGRVVACFAERIMSTYDISETSVHIFGHSMGAQVMGQASSWLSNNFGIRFETGVGKMRNFQRMAIAASRTTPGELF